MVMEGEESNIEKEIKNLEELTNFTLAAVKSTNIATNVLTVKDSIRSVLASKEYTHMSLKETLRDLLSVEEVELSNLDSLRSQTHGAHTTQLMARIAQANRKKSEMQEEVGSLTSSIKHKEQSELQLENRAKVLSQNTSEAIPGIRAENNVCSKITNLKWDFNAPDNEVKGFILQPEKKDIIPFKFDKSTHSQFFTTNYLWEQIGAGSDFLQDSS